MCLMISSCNVHMCEYISVSNANVSVYTLMCKLHVDIYGEDNPASRTFARKQFWICLHSFSAKTPVEGMKPNITALFNTQWFTVRQLVTVSRAYITPAYLSGLWQLKRVTPLNITFIINDRNKVWLKYPF